MQEFIILSREQIIFTVEIKFGYLSHRRLLGSVSVVECSTGDRGAAGLSIIGVTVLCRVRTLIPA